MQRRLCVVLDEPGQACDRDQEPFDDRRCVNGGRPEQPESRRDELARARHPHDHTDVARAVDKASHGSHGVDPPDSVGHPVNAHHPGDRVVDRRRQRPQGDLGQVVNGVAEIPARRVRWAPRRTAAQTSASAVEGGPGGTTVASGRPARTKSPGACSRYTTVPLASAACRSRR